jgi:hypothetical protein
VICASARGAAKTAAAMAMPVAKEISLDIVAPLFRLRGRGFARVTMCARPVLLKIRKIHARG